MNDLDALLDAGPRGAPGARDARDARDAIAQATACLERFTAAFNACDAAAMDAELHFPHSLLAAADEHVWAGPGQHPADLFDALCRQGWAFTRYEAIDPVLSSADKVHFRVTYVRCRADGSVLSAHENLWVVVRRGGRWGIVWRSY